MPAKYTTTDASRQPRRKIIRAARYYTGEPCKRGHVSERFVCRGKCVVCHQEDARRSARRIRQTPEGSKAHKETNKRFLRTPAGQEMQRANYQRLRQTPKRLEASRDNNRSASARKFGFMPPPLEKDCPPRPNRCEYCHKPMDPDKLYMDHNHNTGAFCAWCCPSCNTRITDRIGTLGEAPTGKAR